MPGSHQGLSNAKGCHQICPHLPQWGPDSSPTTSPCPLQVPVSVQATPERHICLLPHFPGAVLPSILQNSPVSWLYL